MIDTHCHLNFEAFKGSVAEVIHEATKKGITHFVVPGTDIASSNKAIALSKIYPSIHPAIGIHPHHAYIAQHDRKAVPVLLEQLDDVLKDETIIAIGEIGLDRHVYESTKYEDYTVTPSFLETQERLFVHQLFLASFIQKPVIVHSRESADWLLDVLQKHWNEWFFEKMVFHCCEANEQLLTFAKKHRIYIGVDGDVTYSKKKAAFIKEVPLERLVLETDSPYLTPEPARQTQKFPNTPANIFQTASFIAKIKGVTLEELEKVTTHNAKTLFNLQ